MGNSDLPKDSQNTSDRDPDRTLSIGEPGGAAGQIGPYRLMQLLGEGGMGEVWLAEQKTPIQRTVALKLIKAGMDTKAVVARFESERQALALMDHPTIARGLRRGFDSRRTAVLCHGVCARPAHHRVLRQTPADHPRAAGICSCRCAMACSTRIRKPSFTAI